MKLGKSAATCGAERHSNARIPFKVPRDIISPPSFINVTNAFALIYAILGSSAESAYRRNEIFNAARKRNEKIIESNPRVHGDRGCLNSFNVVFSSSDDSFRAI